jgi:hypothetical protein
VDCGIRDSGPGTTPTIKDIVQMGSQSASSLSPMPSGEDVRTHPQVRATCGSLWTASAGLAQWQPKSRALRDLPNTNGSASGKITSFCGDSSFDG